MENPYNGAYAVVLGDWHFNALGIVRSLGERGVPVTSLNFSEGGYADSSRYARQVVHVTSAEHALQTLSEIAARNEGTGVLFPCSDETALFLDRNRQTLGASFLVPHADGKMEEWMEKDRMCALAQRAGFRVPESRVVTADRFREIADLPTPFIVKPLASLDGSKADIRVCRDANEARQAAEDFAAGEYARLLVQTFLHGEKEQMIEYCGCKVRGKPVYVHGQLEKIREYPPDRGSTSYARIVPEITYIDTDALDRFLDESGFEGLFDLEIKVTDGTPWFIELNFRNGAPSYAFTAAGFNIPYTWFCAKLGLPEAPGEIRPLRLMSERDDLNHVIDKNIRPGQWLRDLRQTDVCMLFNRADRAPFRTAYNGAVDAALGCIGKRLR